MGTITIDIQNSASVEEFIQAWESYFSTVISSHLLGNSETDKGIV
jgi:hypothetical protein